MEQLLILSGVNHLIIYKLNYIMSAVSDLKDKVTAQGAALDNISTSVIGIQADVAARKEKIGGFNGGASEAEVAELSALVDGVGSKIDAIGATTAALDAETDPTNP